MTSPDDDSHGLTLPGKRLTNMDRSVSMEAVKIVISGLGYTGTFGVDERKFAAMRLVESWRRSQINDLCLW